MMHEAMLYDKIGDGRVRCKLCAHYCLLKDKERGICQVRENRGGILYSLVYGRPIARDVDPIEKKPLFHFLPGTFAYSIATVGCNFTCLYCQNNYIAQYPREHNGRIIGEDISPSQVVAEAKQTGCKTIAYTYTEPTVFFDYAYDIARMAKEDGIRNIFVSNGYMSKEAAKLIIPYLDGINIDLKGITKEFYHQVIGGNLRPVLTKSCKIDLTKLCSRDIIFHYETRCT
jgi:pyruvate formate lyase activating enzyme